MKKRLIPLIFACAALLSAEDFPIGLDKAKIGDSKMPGWNLNTFGFKDGVGKGEIIAGSKEGTKAFKFTTTTRMTAFYTKAVPSKVGDVLEFTARVKGKGTLILGYYNYGDKYVYLQAAPESSRSFKLQPDWQEISCKITVVPSQKGELKYVRPMITLRSNSEVIMEDISIKLTPSAK